MEIAYLTDHPEFVETVAEWLFSEWGQNRPNNSVDATASRLRACLNRDCIPLTVIAVDVDECLGTASLRQSDLDERPELTPWLASVYVAREHRRKGVGSAIVTSIENSARSMGIDLLYLWTPDRQDFYDTLGWRRQEVVPLYGKQISIMSKQL